MLLFFEHVEHFLFKISDKMEVYLHTRSTGQDSRVSSDLISSRRAQILILLAVSEFSVAGNTFWSFLMLFLRNTCITVRAVWFLLELQPIESNETETNSFWCADNIAFCFVMFFPTWSPFYTPPSQYTHFKLLVLSSFCLLTTRREKKNYNRTNMAEAEPSFRDQRWSLKGMTALVTGGTRGIGSA